MELNLFTMLTQLMAQKDALEWLKGSVINYRPNVYKEVKEARDRVFTIRLICMIICVALTLPLMIVSTVNLLDLYDEDKVYGNVDDGKIWYVQDTVKYVPDTGLNTGATGRVVIFFDDNGVPNNVIPLTVYDQTLGLYIFCILACCGAFTVLYLVTSLSVENKYCWQWKMFYKWYHTWIRPKDLDINEFLEMYDRRARK